MKSLCDILRDNPELFKPRFDRVDYAGIEMRMLATAVEQAKMKAYRMPRELYPPDPERLLAGMVEIDGHVRHGARFSAEFRVAGTDEVRVLRTCLTRVRSALTSLGGLDGWPHGLAGDVEVTLAPDEDGVLDPPEPAVIARIHEADGLRQGERWLVARTPDGRVVRTEEDEFALERWEQQHHEHERFLDPRYLPPWKRP